MKKALKEYFFDKNAQGRKAVHAQRRAKRRFDAHVKSLYMELSYYSGLTAAATGSGLFERIQAQDPNVAKLFLYDLERFEDCTLEYDTDDAEKNHVLADHKYLFGAIWLEKNTHCSVLDAIDAYDDDSKHTLEAVKLLRHYTGEVAAHRYPLLASPAQLENVSAAKLNSLTDVVNKVTDIVIGMSFDVLQHISQDATGAKVFVQQCDAKIVHMCMRIKAELEMYTA